MKRLISGVAAAFAAIALLAGCTAPTVEPTLEPTQDAVEQAAQDEPISAYPNKPSTTELSCTDAVVAAANVPASELNNDEAYVSLIACPTHADWMTNVSANPMFFAVDSIGADEVALYTRSVCLDAEETSVCLDAAALGLLE